MNQTLTRILSARENEKCRAAFDKAGYWPNDVIWSVWKKAWEAATLAERERCASVSGPKCAEAILEAAGMACCDNNE